MGLSSCNSVVFCRAVKKCLNHGFPIFEVRDMVSFLDNDHKKMSCMTIVFTWYELTIVYISTSLDSLHHIRNEQRFLLAEILQKLLGELKVSPRFLFVD